MSQSSSVTSVDTFPSIDIAKRRSGITPEGSRAGSSLNHANNNRGRVHQPKPQQPPLFARHYTTLQEHADSVVQAAHADNGVPTPRHEGRRGSFAWGMRTADEEEAPIYTRNPVMPERTDNSTPPTLAELVRRTTVDDDSSTRRSSLVQNDTVFSRPSTTRSSTSGTDMDSLTRTDTGKSSVGGLARSMTKHIPDIRLHHSLEKRSDRTAEHGEEELDDVPPAQSGKKTRKLSFQLPSSLKMKNPPDLPQKPSPVIEESPLGEQPSKVCSQDTPVKCGGLAARRQVKIDLTLPIEPPKLPYRNRSPPGHGIMSNITPSRPRSPKTPWINEKQLNWGRDSMKHSAKTATTLGEGHTYIGEADEVALDDANLLPAQQSIIPPVTTPPTTPGFVRPPQKVRDRCYISKPTPKRPKSGGPSTSESDFGSTPDGHWTPEVTKGMTEQEIRTQDQLGELAKASRSARSRRWPWNKSKASGSDEQMPDEGSKNRKSGSTNIFKRSSRLPDPTTKESKPSTGASFPWRRKVSVDRPPLPSASLANIPVPPTFVPPGLQRVPTPPMFDAASEVKGKLANFFFDSQTFGGTQRRKPKASPGGYWDSDAILMSMQSDIRLTDDEDDEEGPEGRPPAAFHFGPVIDTPGTLASPGLVTSPDGYLAVKSSEGSAFPLPSPGANQDSWFRMHYGNYTPDEDSLTAVALKEVDERRKFEWLIPEHLPNSPLCPLHTKYKGPSKGLCYWHGRKSNGWGIELGRDYVNHPVKIGGGSSGGWDVGKAEGPKEVKRKRRLESLSSH